MKQSRAMSLVESVANVAVGYGVAVVTQILIFPMFGLHTTLAQNFMIGAIFTMVSLARSYVLRRLFETIRVSHRNFGAPSGRNCVRGLDKSPAFDSSSSTSTTSSTPFTCSTLR